MHKQTITPAIIGGDKRMLYAASYLNTKGYPVLTFGFDEELTHKYKLNCAKSLQDVMQKATYLLLPLPYTCNGETVNTPLYEGTITLSNFLGSIRPEHTLFAGKINNKLTETLKKQKIDVFDYCLREDFSVLNAISTAEGALQIAMENTDYTLNGSLCLVTGFGRIAKVLAHYLQGLGAKVTTCARKPSDLAWMNAFGYHSFPIKEIESHINHYDIIFNTVPECIFTDTVLKETKQDTLMIDLASKPGGAGVFGKTK